MTNSDIMLGGLVDGVETGSEGQEAEGGGQDTEEGPRKRIKLEEEATMVAGDESGYVTGFDDSMMNLEDTSQEDLLSNIIQQNIGEVNMLDDTLALFGDNVKNSDMVSDMFDLLASEEVTLYSGSEPGQSQEQAVLKTESQTDPGILTDLRKLFLGEEVSFSLSLLVTSVIPGFKSNVFEVELSDGRECTNNFYFKVGVFVFVCNSTLAACVCICM